MSKKPSTKKKNEELMEEAAGRLAEIFVDQLEEKKRRKKVKNKPKWKPKKFCIGVTIDINTGKVKKRDFIQAKTPEEEKKIEDAFAEQWFECYKIILGDKFDSFMTGIKHYIDKHGEEKFIKEWNKAMKKSDKKNGIGYLINKLISNKEKIFFKLKSRFSDVERYFFIKKEFQGVGIENNQELQKIYKKFYVMYIAGLTPEFFEEYFKILSSRETDLRKILNKLYEIPRRNKTKAVHFSFATKLLHTVDNSLPIYDLLVGRAFDLKVKGHDKDAKINSCIKVYEKLKLYYKELLDNDKIKKIILDFRKEFDCDVQKISDAKILDFLIWANGQVK